LSEKDESVEGGRKVFERAQISVGGKAARRSVRAEAAGDAAVAAAGDRAFKADGAGWQTRISEVLERHAGKAKRKSA
jgi:hypothetical protein